MEEPTIIDRYKSLMVDFIIILEITILLMLSPSYLVKFIAVFIPLVYFPILHTLLSRSIGDIVFKLKIVDQQGNKIGFKLAVNRLFWIFKCSVFALLLTNLLFMFFTLFSGTLKDITEASFDYEGKSKTYLVKTS